MPRGLISINKIIDYWKKERKNNNMIGIVVVVAFQIIFCAKIYANDFFIF